MEPPFRLKRPESCKTVLGRHIIDDMKAFSKAREKAFHDHEREIELLRRVLMNFISSAGAYRNADVGFNDMYGDYVNPRGVLSLAIGGFPVARFVDGMAPETLDGIAPQDIETLIVLAQEQMAIQQVILEQMAIQRASQEEQPNQQVMQDEQVAADMKIAHLIYLEERAENLTVLTAHIPRMTLRALEGGIEKMESITISFDTMPLDLCTDWENNEMLSIIIGLVDEGQEEIFSVSLEELFKLSEDE
ncbi:hypothetical protein H0H87_005621 [Tephrocybe sp. NHM501043]|nr:hypothetical protein H0H87_005621 [Tephrocybe sp. NHM501043]